MLWGSLAAAAASYADAVADGRDPAPELVGRQRVAIGLPDPDTAARRLLEQCYPMIFGYQAALAELTGARDDHARATLAGYRDLRDQLVAVLVDHDQQLPAARAAYRLPVQPTSASSAVRLLGRMETAMLPFVGQWLATTEDRGAALDTMIRTAADALTWTSAIPVWPGWPTQ